VAEETRDDRVAPRRFSISKAAGSMSPPRPRPLMELRPASALPAHVGPYRLGPPSTPFKGCGAIRKSHHLTASHQLPWASRSSARRTGLHRSEDRCTRAVTPPSEFDHRMPPRLMLELRGSSLSSRPLQRSQHGEVTMQPPRQLPAPDLPQPDYDAARGFSPLRRLDSSPNPAGLFHPTHARGVSPSRAFLLDGSRCASRRPWPSWRQPRTFVRLAREPMPWHTIRCGDGVRNDARLHGFAPPSKLTPRDARFRRDAGT
jgi:hypothetical protein